ncbi:MAG: hypothetical protein H6601_09025 [Flavobacteriales bacterium]|nr:hypothetical protein [Flavobacteriales bacterium]
MEANIKVFNSHAEALKAAELLIENGFDAKSISLIGKAELVDDHIHLRSMEPIKDAPAFLGAGAGAIVGLLTGMGVFAIPGFGILYGAGAIIGAIGGFDIGLVGGGIVTILTSLGINKDHVVRYHEHLKEGKFLLMLKADAEKINQAEQLLR